MNAIKTEFKQTVVGMIPKEWQVMSIAECASKESYDTQIGPFGKEIMASEYTTRGVPVIRGVNVNHGRFYDEDFVFISEQKADTLSKYESFPGDVLLVHRGSLGKIGLMPQKRKYAHYILGNSMLRVRCDPAKLLSEYLFYWLSSQYGQNYLMSRTSQVGVPAFASPLATLRQATLPIPPSAEQVAIVQVLAKLDSKIELNQRMNKTLEAICKAIFKHWFIDFEFPNEEGKPYKSSGGEMIHNEFTQNDIPKEWHMGSLSEISKITMGQSPPGNTYNEVGEGMPFYQGVRDFGTRFPNRRVFCTSPTRFAEKEDILLSVRAPVGRLNIANEKCCIGRGLAAIGHFRSYQAYLYTLLSCTQENWNIFEAEGTVFGAATKSNVEDYAILIPPELLQRMFNLQIEAIHTKLGLLEEQSRNLSQIRDSLLPKLMSGKIRVPVETR